ncbi:TIGR02449 family protein [Marinicella sp. W31]|uniref:TIGR02449 family protein n=1 Tax=Marinicella sp. W31 TaxID=3023713 RepID=UPI00375753E1
MEEIKALEQSVNLLLNRLQKIQAENKALQGRLDELLLDKSNLMKKNDQAKTRLESMISRLKNLEQTV